MKISVDEERNIVLEEVYLGVLFKTKEGEELGVAMRDGAFEIYVLDTSVKSPTNERYTKNYRVGGGVVEEMGKLVQGIVNESNKNYK